MAYPDDAAVNLNAITSDARGNVYIGTNNGMIMYKGYRELLKPEAYKLFTTVNGLPSNNVKAIAINYDQYARVQPYIATDNGIMFMDPVCPNCHRQYNGGAANAAFSVQDGNWSNPAVWNTNQVPDEKTEVVIGNDVQVDTDSKCYSLKIAEGGKVRVKNNIRLTIINADKGEIFTGGTKTSTLK